MKLVKFINAILFIALMSTVLADATGWSALNIGAALTIASLVIPKTANFAFMAVTVEIWETDVLENLFKNNDFAKRAYSADQYVLAGKVVHIPRAGSPSAVTKNQDTFPQTAVKRTDNDITYGIDTFYTTPRHIEQIEQYELSYDKRQSAMGEDQMALIQTAMDGLLYNWLPLVANTVLCTGASVPATLADATGNRTGITKTELQTIKKAMDKANIDPNGRVALLTADHYNQFFNSLSEGEKTNFHSVADLSNGIVGKYLGFDIMMRSTVGRYRGADGAFVKVDEYAAGYAASDKTEDRAASLVYQEKCAERALGGVEFFSDAKNPLYYGDIFSYILRMGGRIRRDAGVWAVVEGLAA